MIHERKFMMDHKTHPSTQALDTAHSHSDFIQSNAFLEQGSSIQVFRIANSLKNPTSTIKLDLRSPCGSTQQHPYIRGILRSHADRILDITDTPKQDCYTIIQYSLVKHGLLIINHNDKPYMYRYRQATISRYKIWRQWRQMRHVFLYFIF